VEWTGWIWLRIGASGGSYEHGNEWTFGFYKVLGSSWVIAQLAASQEGLSSMSDLVPNEMTGSDIDDELQMCGENVVMVPFLVIAPGYERRD
jgi:hypothetical protein